MFGVCMAWCIADCLLWWRAEIHHTEGAVTMLCMAGAVVLPLCVFGGIKACFITVGVL